MACMLFAGVGVEMLHRVKDRIRSVDSNIDWANLVNRQPLLPHYRLYRSFLMEAFQPEALQRLKSGPEIRILLARPPRWLGPTAAVLLGFAAYALEKHTTGPLHPLWGSRLGFRPEIVTVEECRTGEELAEVILASSCTPPILPKMVRHGGPVLDGGLIDNAPLAAIGPGEGPTLVLLTRRYDPAKLSGHPDRVYLQPSRKIPIAKWDYTSPELMQATYDLGISDAELYLTRGPAALQV